MRALDAHADDLASKDNKSVHDITTVVSTDQNSLHSRTHSCDPKLAEACETCPPHLLRAGAAICFRWRLRGGVW
jgi:hypothetical protein